MGRAKRNPVITVAASLRGMTPAAVEPPVALSSISSASPGYDTKPRWWGIHDGTDDWQGTDALEAARAQAQDSKAAYDDYLAQRTLDDKYTVVEGEHLYQQMVRSQERVKAAEQHCLSVYMLDRARRHRPQRQFPQRRI